MKSKQPVSHNRAHLLVLAPSQTGLAAEGPRAEEADVQLQPLVLPQTSAGQQAKHFALNSKPTKLVQGSSLISDQMEREQNVWPALPTALLGHCR